MGAGTRAGSQGAGQGVDVMTRVAETRSPLTVRSEPFDTDQDRPVEALGQKFASGHSAPTRPARPELVEGFIQKPQVASKHRPHPTALRYQRAQATSPKELPCNFAGMEQGPYPCQSDGGFLRKSSQNPSASLARRRAPSANGRRGHCPHTRSNEKCQK